MLGSDCCIPDRHPRIRSEGPTDFYRREEGSRSRYDSTDLPDRAVIDNIPRTFVTSKAKRLPKAFEGNADEA